MKRYTEESTIKQSGQRFKDYCTAAEEEGEGFMENAEFISARLQIVEPISIILELC